VTGERGAGDGWVDVAVRVRPGARRAAVGGCWAGPGGPALLVAVAAPAVEGKATDAVLAAVADALGVRTRDVTLRSGARSRDKVLRVRTGDPDAVLAAARRLRGDP
jgi:hypothetical protein